MWLQILADVKAIDHYTNETAADVIADIVDKKTLVTSKMYVAPCYGFGMGAPAAASGIVYGLVLRKYDGDLEHLYQRTDNLLQRHRFEIIGKIVEGLNHIHTQGVLHSDIKNGNILYRMSKEKDRIVDISFVDWNISCKIMNDQTHGAGTTPFRFDEWYLPDGNRYANEEKTDFIYRSSLQGLCRRYYDWFSLVWVILDLLRGRSGRKFMPSRTTRHTWMMDVRKNFRSEQGRRKAANEAPYMFMDWYKEHSKSIYVYNIEDPSYNEFMASHEAMMKRFKNNATLPYGKNNISYQQVWDALYHLSSYPITIESDAQRKTFQTKLNDAFKTLKMSNQSVTCFTSCTSRLQAHASHYRSCGCCLARCPIVQSC